MTGIAIALFDEAYEFIKHLNHQKNSSYSSFTGRLEGHNVSLFLCRPGLKKNQNRFRQWIRENSFSEVILTGFCGSLTPVFRPGDIPQICHILSHENLPPISLCRKGKTILTVDRPILGMEGREDILSRFKTDLVDMESYIVSVIMAGEFPEIPFSVIKAVGDTAGEDDLMKNETKMRSFFSSFGIWAKIKIALGTGFSFFEIYRRKRYLQKRIYRAVMDRINGKDPYAE